MNWAKMISPLNKKRIQEARTRWNQIAKPLYSFGKLEDILCQLAGIQGTIDISLKKKALVVFCSDNGVVEEGVTQTGQEVTAIVAENFLKNQTSVAIMCQRLGVDLFPVDIGMKKKTKVPDYHIRRGTDNMVKGPAMRKEEAMKAIEVGLSFAKSLKEQGYEILATGEMGIGNTTTSTAVASVLLEIEPKKITGPGAGLSKEGMKRKRKAIETAIEVNQPNKEDPLDVLHKIGGFDLAGLVGLYLGCGIERLPVIIDGFISAVAALVAQRLAPSVTEYMIASHTSTEPGMQGVLKALGKSACLDCGMSLGEGTGGVSLFPLLDLALDVFQNMSTFQEIEIKEYEEFQ